MLENFFKKSKDSLELLENKICTYSQSISFIALKLTIDILVHVKYYTHIIVYLI